MLRTSCGICEVIQGLSYLEQEAYICINAVQLTAAQLEYDKYMPMVVCLSGHQHNYLEKAFYTLDLHVCVFFIFLTFLFNN